MNKRQTFHQQSGSNSFSRPMAAAPNASSKSHLAKDGISITSSRWPLEVQTMSAIFRSSANLVIARRPKPTSQRRRSQSAGNCAILARRAANDHSPVAATHPSRKRLMARLSGDRSEERQKLCEPKAINPSQSLLLKYAIQHVNSSRWLIQVLRSAITFLALNYTYKIVPPGTFWRRYQFYRLRIFGCGGSQPPLPNPRDDRAA